MKFENIDRVVAIRRELTCIGEELQHIAAIRESEYHTNVALYNAQYGVDDVMIRDASQSIVNKVLDMYELELRTKEKEMMDELETL